MRSPTHEFDKTKLNAAQKELRRIAHHTLEKVTDDIGRRRSFNTAVAAVMELLNAISKLDASRCAGRVVAHEALEIAVMCLSPMIPHVTHELWHQLGHETALIHGALVDAGSGRAGAGHDRDFGAGQRQDARARQRSGGCDAGRRRAGGARRCERAEIRRRQADQEGHLRAGQAREHRRMKGTVPNFPNAGLIPFCYCLRAAAFTCRAASRCRQAFAYTYIDTKDEQTDFVQDLRKALIASGVNVIRTQGSSGATINVHDDELTERMLSVSARNIPTEYELTYKVEFSVSSGGKTLIEHEEISATRDISFDETQLLAKEREQEILREALARDLVALVMRRLASL